ncbi:T9SS type A sorting domain-containing protein [Desertivirga xinjiangensis]|uniref:T9SS type A sorting domain-containing protein n=1 Tax=Desertivirga xinjiangensis TaxID=539206 RepID=UPI00210A3640|nr:T9SS type A sorting domain-containing protein [Pedobacter xinjiangensis]
MDKTLLLFTLLLCVAGSAFSSTLVQGSWRWRNDDGNENTATFKAAENTSITINDYGVIRLRVRVENQSTTQTHAVGALKYSTSLTDVPVLITSDPSVNAFVYVQSDLAPDSKEPTTNSSFLTTVNTAGLSPFDYAAGQYFDRERFLANNDDKSPVGPSTYSDMEFVIRPTANVLPGTTYYFIAENTKSDEQVPSNENNFAVLKTASTLPVDFVSFQAKTDKDRVQLSWITASEKNNDRFEISRSTDARSWQSIGEKKGKGTSSKPSSYNFVDHLPLNGTSYYQLSQYDFDGTKKVLSVQSVNLSLKPFVDVQVFPNPATSEINLSLRNYPGQGAEVSLFSQDGKLIHKERLKKDIELHKLSINQMPEKGVYILKVVGDDLNLSKKVIIL